MSFFSPDFWADGRRAPENAIQSSDKERVWVEFGARLLEIPLNYSTLVLIEWNFIAGRRAERHGGS
jgi:hypothetical protein